MRSNSRVARSLAAARRIRFWPAAGSALLSLANDGALGTPSATVHCNTLLQLLHHLSPWPREVAIRTALRNFPYVGKVLSRYDNARLLVSPDRFFRWDIAIYDASHSPPPRARTHCEIRYDYRPSLKLAANEFVLPYGMHPALLEIFPLAELRPRIRLLRTSPRQRRIFFAGSSGKFYSKAAESPALAGKLDRNAILTTLRDTGEFREARSMGELAPCDRGEMLLVDSGVCPIPIASWLPSLASADFAICPPGCLMPMCFNIIEAMAVGTVPITNYPEWFYPALEDGRTCIAFDTRDDLLRKLAEITNLSQTRIDAMRQAVGEYYDLYLAPGLVSRQIASYQGRHMILHVLDETTRHLADSA